MIRGERLRSDEPGVCQTVRKVMTMASRRPTHTEGCEGRKGGGTDCGKTDEPLFEVYKLYCSWLFVNSCKGKKPIYRAKEFFHSFHAKTSLSVCSGLTLRIIIMMIIIIIYCC
jgi:hypothetical protein